MFWWSFSFSSALWTFSLLFFSFFCFFLLPLLPSVSGSLVFGQSSQALTVWCGCCRDEGRVTAVHLLPVAVSSLNGRFGDHALVCGRGTDGLSAALWSTSGLNSPCVLSMNTMNDQCFVNASKNDMRQMVYHWYGSHDEVQPIMNRGQRHGLTCQSITEPHIETKRRWN